MRTPQQQRKRGQHLADGRPKKRNRARRLKQLLESVEQERANLSRVESLLECLRIAMEYQSQASTGPYYPDVAQIAHELVHKSVNALDLIHQTRSERDKVQEEFQSEPTQLRMQFQRIRRMQVAGGVSAGLCAAPPLALLPSAPLCRVFAGNLRIQLHRRNYSRASAARSASSALSHSSAAVKISEGIRVGSR
jgi:hypothetical protein